MKSMDQSWQFFIAICNEDDGWTLRGQLSLGYDCTHCHGTFKFAVVEISLQFDRQMYFNS